jgi:hypothetical protein
MKKIFATSLTLALLGVQTDVNGVSLRQLAYRENLLDKVKAIKNKNQPKPAEHQEKKPEAKPKKEEKALDKKKDVPKIEVIDTDSSPAS